MRITLFAAAALSASLWAQTPADGDAAAGNELPTGAPPGIELIDRQGLEQHAVHLASDELGGRYTSTPGQVAAAEYIAAHFKKLGLEPLGDRKSYFQHYPVVKSYLVAKATKLKFGQRSFSSGFAVVPGEKTTKLGIGGGFVFAEYGAPSSFPKGLKRSVPVVVARTRNSGARGTMSSRRDVLKYYQVAREAASQGARALVVCLLDDNTGLADTFNYSALLPGKPILGYGKKGKEVARPTPIPIVFTSSEVSRALLAAMKVKLDQNDEFTAPKKAKTSGRLDLSVKVDKKVKAMNVCAKLAGTTLSKQAIVFSAHMDHIGTRLDGDAFNGADDNASGTSGLLEIAEAVAKCEDRPKRTMIFLSVSGEELGLWGSKYYANHPTWPASKIVANINIDMIGREGDISGKNEISATPSHRHEMFSTLVQDAAEFASKLGLGLTSGDKYYARSDHYNFAQKGIPVVFFCDGEHADYHKVTDHADKLDFEKMEKIARLAYWTGRAVADSPKRPKKLGERDGWRQ